MQCLEKKANGLNTAQAKFTDISGLIYSPLESQAYYHRNDFYYLS